MISDHIFRYFTIDLPLWSCRKDDCLLNLCPNKQRDHRDGKYVGSDLKYEKAHLSRTFILPLNSARDPFYRQTNACHYFMLKGNIESDLEQAGTDFFLLI